MLFRITAPHFVAGVIEKERAAPIISYMVAWDLMKILDYCAKKGWEVEVCGP